MNFLYHFSFVLFTSTLLSSSSWSVNDGIETELSSSASVSRQSRSTELTLEEQNQLAHLGLYYVEKGATSATYELRRLLPELPCPVNSDERFFQEHVTSNLELNDLDIARAQFRVAQLLGDNQISMALIFLKSAKQYIESLPDQTYEFPELDAWIDYLNQFEDGIHYQSQGLFYRAYDSLNHAKKIAEKNEIPFSWRLLFYLGKTMVALLAEKGISIPPDMSKDGISFLQKVIKETNGTSEHKYMYESYYWIGNAISINNLTLAYHYFAKAAPGIKHPLEKAHCYLQMGAYHNSRNETQQSEECYRNILDALADQDQSDERVKRMKMSSLRVLSNISSELQRHEDVILYGTQAFEIFEPIFPEEKGAKAHLAYEIGRSYVQLGQYDLAKEYCEMALSAKALRPAANKVVKDLLKDIDKKQKSVSKARPTITFDTSLETAKNEAKLQGKDYASAEGGIASLEKLMRNPKITKAQRHNARIAWMEAAIVLAEAYLDKGMFENIIKLFKGKEDDLKGKDALAKKCQALFTAAQKSEAKGKAPAVQKGAKHLNSKKSKKKEAQFSRAPEVYAPEVKSAGNPFKSRSRTNSSSSSENDSSPVRSRSDSGASRALIRQDSLRLIEAMHESEEFNTKKMTEDLVRKFGEGARKSVFAELNKQLFLAEQRLGLRKKKKAASAGKEQPVYEVAFARPDLATEVPAEQQKKFEVLLEELKRDPRIGRGKPETLTGNLQGHMSRKLNKEHRLVYTIDDENRLVTIVSVKGHYGD